jgi:two-component system chemotaxis response regulator CheY
MVSIESINKEIGILIVDDHLSTRDLIRAILRGSGFINLFMADNGLVALNTLAHETVHLIICDWNMPVMNGLETLKEVRSDPRYSNLPFIMLTAEAYKESIVAAVEAKVSDYVAKPFTAEVLLNKISKVLSK